MPALVAAMLMVGGIFPGGLLAYMHLGEAEVEDFHGSVRLHHDVAGFQIPMDDAFFVRGFEGGGDSVGDVERFVRWQRTFRVFAFDEVP